jgi:hypothetical protein
LIRFPWAIAITTFFVGCVYDHRVTQAIIERRRRAKEAEGSEIHATHTGVAGAGTRRGRLRFYVAKDFREQHREWRHALSSLADAANGVVGPNFRVQFEVAAATEWIPKCDQARLESCLAELERLDAGEDGDWVVGVLGATASFTSSFEHLGMARSVGRHFVVRDVSDLAERAAIDSAFATFTPARRDEIYKRRKTHKRLAVFLHEWGHTLGAMHIQNVKSLLNPTYDDSMESFDDANHGLVDASLRDVFRYAGTRDELKAYLHSSSGGGLPAEERNALLAQLERNAPQDQGLAASAPKAAPLPEHPFLVKGREDELLVDLDQGDRETYTRAATLTAAGDVVSALELTKPLGEKHPDNYAVQHLLCGLAMQLGQHVVAQQACPRASGPGVVAK